MPYGGMLRKLADKLPTYFITGEGLEFKGRYLVRTKKGTELGRTDDINWALAWRTTASIKGVIVEVHEDV